MDPKQRIEQLKQLIRQHNHAYFVLDNPTISDVEYDQLIQELTLLELRYPEYVTSDSPTQMVGDSISPSFSKVEHSTPMLSLSNAFNAEELNAFAERLNKNKFSVTYVVEPKIDGLAATLRYRNGLLVLGATRGNGLVGEDITDNIKVIESVPLQLSQPVDIEVRGEIFMSKSAFAKLNQKRLEIGEPLFKNPRNAAAGTMRGLNVEVVASRGLQMFVYAIAELDEDASMTHNQVLTYLKSLGFNVNDQTKLAEDIDSAIIHAEYFEQQRTTYPYDIDGAVIKVNERHLYGQIGYTAKSPKWAIAYKFKAEEAISRIHAIEYQVGRTGQITPVAHLTPVFIQGSTVAKATLHNADYIADKDIRVDDDVIIRKAGDIIPEVVSVILKNRAPNTQPTGFIQTCPICDTPLHRIDSEVDYYCMNPACSGKTVEGLIHFASRQAMNIDGLGDKIIRQWYALDYLKTIPDIYTLHQHKDTLTAQPGFGEKSIEKILQAIEASKTNSLELLLFGLGIRYVGQKVAKVLAVHFNTLFDIIQATREALIDVPEIGDKIADSIIASANNPVFINTIETLQKYGVNMTYQNAQTQSTTVAGLTFVLTGTLPNLSRQQAKAMIEAAGGKVTSTVSTKTSYLCAGDAAGSKLKQAEKLKIPIIDEQQLKALLDRK